MLTIEAQLHNTLMDIAPDMHEIDEQTIIIAEAADIIRRLSGKRTSFTKYNQSTLMDALLTSMSRIAEWNEEEPLYDPFDGTGLTANQIVKRASSYRVANKYWGDMDILNEEELSPFLNKTEKIDNPNSYDIIDTTYEDKTMHPDDLYHTPKTPRHRTDSIVR